MRKAVWILVPTILVATVLWFILARWGEGDSAGGTNGDGAAKKDAASNPDDRRGTFTLTLLDPDMEPVAGWSVTFHPRGERWKGGESDAKGRVVLEDVDPGVPGHLSLVSKREHSVLRTVTRDNWYPRDETIELELQFTIKGRVVDETGAPCVDCAVFWRLVRKSVTDVTHVLMEKDGAFTITQLGEREMVQVAAELGTPQRPQPPAGFGVGMVKDGPAVKTAKAGTKDMVLRVRRGSVLKIRFPDWPASDGEVGPLVTLIAQTTLRTHETVVGPRGEATFFRLQAGESYRMRMFGAPGNRYVDAVDLEPHEWKQSVPLRLGRIIKGRLLVPEETPVESLEVKATIGKPPSGPGREGILPYVVKGTVSADTYEFRIEGLPPGVWTVSASRVKIGEGRTETFLTNAEVQTGKSVELDLRKK